MKKSRIITTDEIKKITNITGSSDDAFLEIWNDSMTETLCLWLNIKDFGKHQIVDERVKTYDLPYLILNDFPVDLTETFSLKRTLDNSAIIDYTFKQDPGEIRTVRTYDTVGNPKHLFGHEEVLVTYTAGYSLKDTVEVLDNTDLAEKKIRIFKSGVAIEYTFKASSPTGNQIEVGLTLDETASNIATKLEGSVIDAVVTLPLGSSIELVSATSVQLDIVSADIPQYFKTAIALMVGGASANKNKKPGIKSYTLGTKTVTFRDESEITIFKTIIAEWLPKFKRAKIIAI